MIRYPQYLTQEQIELLQEKFKTVYALAKAANTHRHYTGEQLRQHRRISRATVIKFARACGIPTAKFESYFDNV